LLLLDEPFSALDGSSSDALILRLRTWLHDQRVQTILVTHDATDAYSTAAEVALLHEGRLAALGPADVALAAERRRIIDRLGPKQP
jgi:ABC-type sulfate/molybdate transport systems ATPase subunit